MRRLDSSIMNADTDPDAFLYEIYQLRDELGDLGEAVPTERLATIILDVLPAENYSTINIQAIKNPDISLGDIEGAIKTIYMNHCERSPVPKRSQKSYCESRDRGRESIMRDNGRETAIAAVLTCPNCKKPGHRMKHRKTLTKK